MCIVKICKFVERTIKLNLVEKIREDVVSKLLGWKVLNVSE